MRSLVVQFGWWYTVPAIFDLDNVQKFETVQISEIVNFREKISLYYLWLNATTKVIIKY